MAIILDPSLLRDSIIFSNIIALMSVGITTTYMTTKVPNFAHGDFVTVGIYCTITVTEVFKVNPYIGVPIGFLLGGVSGFVMYRLVMRPQVKKKASVVLLMITTLSVDIFFIGVLNVYADYLANTFRVLSRSLILRNNDFLIAGYYPAVLFASSILLVSSAVLLHLLLNKTKFGVALRAVVEDADLAGTMGINVQRVYSFSWFISGGLAGLAGALTPLFFLVSTNTGSLLIVEIFAGSLLGGVYSISGTFLGGYVIGMADEIGSNLLGQIFGPAAAGFRPVIPLVLMVAVLLVLPTGIGGLRLRGQVKS